MSTALKQISAKAIICVSIPVLGLLMWISATSLAFEGRDPGEVYITIAPETHIESALEVNRNNDAMEYLLKQHKRAECGAHYASSYTNPKCEKRVLVSELGAIGFLFKWVAS